MTRRGCLRGSGSFVSLYRPKGMASLYQPMDLEDPREPMFQQFEAFGNAMTAFTTAATGSYGWRGQEGSESEFVDTPEASTPAQTSPNLILMQARHYDPTIGRFLQADPLKMSSFTTQGLNRYIYCNNDPVNRSDPSGLCYQDYLTPAFLAVGQLAALVGAVLAMMAAWAIGWAAGDAIGCWLSNNVQLGSLGDLFMALGGILAGAGIGLLLSGPVGWALFLAIAALAIGIYFLAGGLYENIVAGREIAAKLPGGVWADAEATSRDVLIQVRKYFSIVRARASFLA